MQQSSAELTALRRSLASGGTRPGSTAVTLRLEDGSNYAVPGTVEFSEATVNEATGTVTLRARFPNPGGLLLPGMFVRSDEHTSALQSLMRIPYSVFCLKNKQPN